MFLELIKIIAAFLEENCGWRLFQTFSHDWVKLYLQVLPHEHERSSLANQFSQNSVLTINFHFDITGDFGLNI